MLLLQASSQVPLAIILTAVASIIAALGLKELWPILFNRKDSDCVRNIIKLATAIEILLMIIKDKHSKDPGLVQAIDQVEGIVEEINNHYRTELTD
ncbi:MAG: hypothetical protein AAFY48_00800 [Bacteroidota bacterium]